MAVTILQRPEGEILGSCITALIDDNGGGGDFRIISTSHGLITGDHVYVTSDVEDYNGFWVVDFDGVNTFFIKPYSSGSRVQYISGSSVDYCPSEFTHGWSAVHLPITYRLSNNLYPVNSSDTSRSINSVQEANGYTVLQLSGSPGTLHSYDFIKLTLPNDTDLSGVYQILEWISSTVMIINLQYDASNNFTSATAIKHYNNYNILVRVYAGINASHEWTAQKPYELAATLQFIPDENNEVFFSINEILKSYIETRNNLVLGTLPNNIDFWCNFYIETAETYDDSDGYTFGTNTGYFTSDQSNFEGTAVNAKLDFKNQYSGYLSEYLMTNNTAKFLTLFTIPVLFSCGEDTPDCYSDISFLQDKSKALITTIRKQYYLNGVLQTTVDTSIDEDSGVIRAELEADCSYDRVDVTLIGGNQFLDEPEFDATGNWLQTATAGPNWSIASGMASVIMPTSYPASEMLYQTISGSAGNYRVISSGTLTAETAPQDGDYRATIYFMSGGTGGTIVKQQQLGVLSGTGASNILSYSYDAVISVGGSFDTIVILLPGQLPDSSGGGTVNIQNLFVFNTNQTLSETKQFRIDCGCSNKEIRLSWLNNLSGFEPTWAFTANKDHIREIQEVITTKKNILPTWPKSYGSDADTIKKQTKRVSNKAYTVRTQFLTNDEADALSYIKSSILVQIVNSRTDRRTVIVDTDSFVVRQDSQDTKEIAFNISFTNDIPVQTL